MSARSNGKQAGALVYAIRPAVVLRYGGQICGVLAVLSTVPLAVSVVCGALRESVSYAGVIALLSSIAALSRRAPASRTLQSNEAFAITSISFVLASLLLALPMHASGLGASSALFEAVSAVTTTGLSAAGGHHDASFVFAFGRAWAQWYGGLGIVVLSLALVTGPGVTSRQLAGQGVDQSDLIGNTRSFARATFQTYGLVTLGGCALLLLSGAGLADAVLHTLSGVSTGGFSPHADSLASVGWPQRYAVILLCLLGAVPLIEYRLLLFQRTGSVARRIQLPALAVAASASVLALAAALYWVDGRSGASSLADGLLVGVSAQTTAGFTTLDVDGLSSVAKIVLIASMVVGGGVGSTAGGIKILRILVLLRVVQILVRRTCLPRHAVLDPRLGGQRLEPDEIQQMLSLILLFVLVIGLSWVPFLAYGYEPLAALFEVVSATGTVGLSSGISSPDLPVPLKAVLCVDMLLGRLEILVFLVLFYPGAWFGRRLEAG